MIVMGRTLIILLLVSFISCLNGSKMDHNMKTPDNKIGNSLIISCPVVEKAFVKKNGQVTDHKEYYLQRSIQDYFIKFCESNITRKELEAHLQNIDSEIKTMKVEVEFREGEWDNCDEEHEVQSRRGEYAIIIKIVE